VRDRLRQARRRVLDTIVTDVRQWSMRMAQVQRGSRQLLGHEKQFTGDPVANYLFMDPPTAVAARPASTQLAATPMIIDADASVGSSPATLAPTTKPSGDGDGSPASPDPEPEPDPVPEARETRAPLLNTLTPANRTLYLRCLLSLRSPIVCAGPPLQQGLGVKSFGHEQAPSKTLLLRLCADFPVAVLSEWCTSKVCHRCGSERVLTDRHGWRLWQCPGCGGGKDENKDESASQALAVLFVHLCLWRRRPEQFTCPAANQAWWKAYDKDQAAQARAKRPVPSTSPGPDGGGSGPSGGGGAGPSGDGDGGDAGPGPAPSNSAGLARACSHELGQCPASRFADT